MIVYLGLLPLGELSKPFSGGSFFGRALIALVVPVYEKVSGEPVKPPPRPESESPARPVSKEPVYNPSSKQW